MILVCTPSRLEFDFLKTQLKELINSGHIKLRQSGIGSVATTHSISKFIQALQPDLIIHVGIAGAFKNKELAINDVVEINAVVPSLLFEEQNGEIKSLFDINLLQLNEFPYTDGQLVNPRAHIEILKKCRSLQVGMTSGSKNTIDFRKALNCEIEDMESEGLFYSCLIAKQEFMSIRAISNYVEIRNANTWEIKSAMEQIVVFILRYLVLKK